MPRQGETFINAVGVEVVAHGGATPTVPDHEAAQANAIPPAEGIGIDVFGREYDERVPVFLTTGTRYVIDRIATPHRKGRSGGTTGRWLDVESLDKLARETGHEFTSVEIGLPPEWWLLTNPGYEDDVDAGFGDSPPPVGLFWTMIPAAALSGGDNAGFQQGVDGAFTPQPYVSAAIPEGETTLAYLGSFGANWANLRFHPPGEFTSDYQIPGVIAFTVKIEGLGQVTLNWNSDLGRYQGTYPGIRDHLTTEAGNPLNVELYEITSRVLPSLPEGLDLYFDWDIDTNGTDEWGYLRFNYGSIDPFPLRFEEMDTTRLGNVSGAGTALRYYMSGSDPYPSAPVQIDLYLVDATEAYMFEMTWTGSNYFNTELDFLPWLQERLGSTIRAAIDMRTDVT